MINLKFKITDRLLSILLIVVILASAVPITAFADTSTEEQTKFMGFQVYYSENKPLSSANISYEIYNGTDKLFSEKLITDDNGAAEIKDNNFSQYIVDDSSLKLNYTVSKEEYKSRTEEVSITADMLGKDITVNLDKTGIKESEKVTLTFNKKGDGDGTIKVNNTEVDNGIVEVDKGKEVKIIFSANNNNNSYIESISKDNISLEIDSDSKSEYTIAPENDITYNVEFGKMVSLTLDSKNFNNEKCRIQLDAENIDTENLTKLYKSGTNVNLTVSADAGNSDDGYKNGYQISSVKIGNEEKITSKSNKNTYNTEFTINSNTDINIDFVKTYVVELKYDPSNIGTTELTSSGVKLDGIEGKVFIVPNGSSVNVKVTPNNGYKILSVTYNGADSEDLTKKINEDGVYSDEFNIKQDYTIGVAFKLKEYNINIEPDKSGENRGVIETDHTSVQYGNPYKITIKPEDGYTLDSLKINSENINSENIKNYNIEYNENNEAVITITNVTSDQTITPTFKKIEKTRKPSACFSIPTNNHLWKFGNKYIFKKDDKFTIKSKGYKLRIYTLNNSLLSEIDPNDSSKNSLEINSDTTITKIQFFDKLDGELIKAWHTVEEENSLNIGFDKEAPKVNMSVVTNLSGTSNPIGTSNTGENIYKEDVKVNITVEDKEISSGIKSISYKLINDNKETTDTLYSFDYKRDEDINNNSGTLTIQDWDYNKQTLGDAETQTGVYPTEEQLRKSWDGTFIINGKNNNSDNVVLEITVVDNAGNESTSKLIKVKNKDNEEITVDHLNINTDTPEFKINFDDSIKGIKANKVSDEGRAYYGASRTATLKVTNDRASSFDQGAATKSIENIIKIKDGETANYDISWENEPNDSNTHKAKITFKGDANYTIDTSEFSYTNKAGNESTEKNITLSGDNNKQFTVDGTVPYSPSVKIEPNVWDKLLSTITFGLFGQKDVKVKITGEDKTSPVTIEYYKTDKPINGTTDKEVQEELDKLYDQKKFSQYDGDGITLSPNQQFVIYARVTDYAGNYIYSSSDGYILESTAPSIIDMSVVDTVPSGTSNTGENIYNEDVKVNIKVEDNKNNAISSGIKKISYEVIKDDKEKTQWGDLYSFDYKRDEDINNNDGTLTIQDWDSDNQKLKDKETFTGVYPTEEQLRKSWDGKLRIDKNLNNSCNVKVIITVTDNAGNENSKEVELDIDCTAPDVGIKFDSKSNKGAVDEYYTARTATITVTERTAHFNYSEGINIKAVDAKGKPVESAYTISEWTTTEDPADANNATHTATINFAKDANYTFSYNCIDKANNKCQNINNCEFTVDKTKPDSSSVEIGSNNVWDKLLSTITFGLFGQKDVKVKITGEDKTSPVTIEYYKTDKPINGTTDKEVQGELDKLYTQKKFFEYDNIITLSPDQQFVIYARVTDYAGNYIYSSSDGYILDSTDPDITLEILTEPSRISKTGENFYNKDVEVKIEVEDNKNNAISSGIKKISYEVIKDDKEKTQWGDLYSFDYQRDTGDNNNGGALTIQDWDYNKQTLGDAETQTGVYPTEDQLRKSWDGELRIDKNLNNSCNVKVIITVIDNAGNKSSKEVGLDIDCTAPDVGIKFDSKSNKGAVDEYYTARKATITVTERTAHFNYSEGINIKAVDAKGKPVESAYTISEWTTTEDPADANNATHTATINFAKDANYTFSYNCIDKANNKCKNINKCKFTVDKTAPTGTLTAVSAEGRKKTWNNSDFNKSLTFGFWSNKRIRTSGTSNDMTSPIAKVEYYKVSSKGAVDGVSRLTANELDKVVGWKNFSGFDTLANEQFVVYVRITDCAGNYSYIKTNGLIVDDQRPIEEVIAPEITITPPQPVNGIYNRNVKVSISVKDPLTGGTYSGLKNVSYQVFNNSVSSTKPTQKGTLYSFDKVDPKQSDLVQKIDREIIIDSSKNNSNNVQIVVYAEDNAGNSSDDDISIKIDTTAPTITVSYDNNNADSAMFFKQNRTATISIEERNFNAQDVKFDIKNTEGNSLPTISPWTMRAGTGNLDNTIWTATVTYSNDGVYEFDVSYTDLAGNKCTGVDYAAGSVAEKKFVIDKIVPTVSVSYDNNSVQNDMYYKANRTATVTIKEHNFDQSRVNVTINASEADSGNALTAPKISAWTSSGNDIYTAKVEYSFDAKFTFDIAIRDKAGNNSADFAKQTFIVDKTAPTLTITGVNDKSANNGDVIPVVKYYDVNFDKNRVDIKLDSAENNITKFEGKYTNENSNGQTFTFNNFGYNKEFDDIYTLTASITDKAGNTTNKYIEFSVNRFGSTYKISEATKKLNGSYTNRPIDVEISEINVDELTNIKITVFKDNEAISLKENTDYKITTSGGNGQWYCYNYKIFAQNFSDDGVYRISVHSEDKAGNTAENTLDTKNVNISFGIDKTKPNIVITNIESGNTYAVDNITVKILPEDNLLLENIKVYVDDYNNPYKSWTADEIKDLAAKNGEFKFDISGDSTSAHNIKIVCTDAAGNEQVEEVTNVFVTTNLFVRYYNNKLLFWGSICAIVLIVILIVVLVSAKKKYSKTKNMKV